MAADCAGVARRRGRGTRAGRPPQERQAQVGRDRPATGARPAPSPVLGDEVDAAVDGLARATGRRAAGRRGCASPPASGRTPNSASRSDVLPAPTSPNRPTISPATEVAAAAVGRVRRAGRAADRRGRSGARARCRRAPAGRASPLAGARPEDRRRRSRGRERRLPELAHEAAVAQHADAARRDPRPPAGGARRRARRRPSPIMRRIVANRRWVSRSESAEVGSSRTRRRGSPGEGAREDDLLAVAGAEAVDGRVERQVEAGPAAMSARAARTSRRRYSGGRSSRPPRRSSGEVLRHRVAGQDPGVDLLVDGRDPRRAATERAPEAERHARRSAPRPRRDTAPARIRMSVDLPAPLAPTSP